MRAVVAVAVVLLACGSPAPAAAQPPPPPSPSGQSDPHGGHDHQPPDRVPGEVDDRATQQRPDPAPALPPHIPVLTDADRAAAFPVLEVHAGHTGGVHAFLLFDRMEWLQGRAGHSSLAWNGQGWIGGDLHRVWFRLEGEGDDGRVREAGMHALFGRAIAPWWDLVAGVRQDVRPGSPQTWAAIGIQGLAPYWFEVEATAYLGAGGRTRVQFESHYDLLLTNRLILQPHLELDVYGRSDPERNIGAGLSSADWGVRLRYEIRRELAPYAGLLWHRTFFGTREHAVAAGEVPGGARLALGVRFWF